MRSLIPALVFTLCYSLNVSASVSEDELAQLKSTLQSLMSRVESLETENASLKDSSTKMMALTKDISNSGARKSTWVDKVTWKGDVRYRYENIDAERSDTRERNRVRARAALIAKPADNLEVGIGLASGSSDPVSTNQTLGGGGSTKDLRLDLAYFAWQPKPGVKVIGGKMKNVWFKPGGNGLMWDGDLRPEGLAVTYDRDNFFVNTGINFLESDTKTDNARIAYGIQSGFDGETRLGQLIAGVGYFDIGTQGREVFFGDNDDFFGNSYSCVNPAAPSGCTFDNDYNELEVFAQLKTQLGGKPLMLFADYVKNQDADTLDTAWAAGLKLGKASAPRSWELAYTYQDIEADAVMGLLADSDFGGGGTDAKGHVFKGAYAINKAWKVGFTYFQNQRNVDTGVEEDYNRLQIDTAFKF